MPALWAAGRRSQATLAYIAFSCALLPLMRRASGDAAVRHRRHHPRPLWSVCARSRAAPQPHPDRPAATLSPATSGLHSPGWPCPLWDTLALPIRALLYVRAGRAGLDKEYPWDFHSKLELAAELVGWLVLRLRHTGKAVWLAADGAMPSGPS